MTIPLQAHNNGVNLSATKIGNDIVLTWVEPATVAPVHKVWRDTDPTMATRQKIDTTNLGTTTDVDIPLLGQCFFYQVENVIE